MRSVPFFRGTPRPNRDTLPGSVREKEMVLNREKEQDARITNEALWRLCFVAMLYKRRDRSGFRSQHMPGKGGAPSLVGLFIFMKKERSRPCPYPIRQFGALPPRTPLTRVAPKMSPQRVLARIERNWMHRRGRPHR